MENQLNKSHFFTQRNLTLLSFVVLFIYLLFRAFFVPNVYDESATFFHYIQKGSFIPPNAHWDANNHILNSALSYLSYLTFGSSMLALRLPNILISILFFFYTYKVSKELSNKVIQWTFIITLCFAHNFIEFFALARGYGMSMAFLFGAIYHVMQVLKKNNLTDYFTSVVFMSLAILANLTLINTAIVIVAILLINTFLNRSSIQKGFSLKAISIIIIGGILPIALLIGVLLEFKKKGLLYYGTLEGFWELSVKTLIKLLTESDSILIPIVIITFFIVVITLPIYQLIRFKKLSVFWDKKYLFSALFLANLLAILIMANVMGINYPEDRTGIYFFPFFIGAILFSFDIIYKQINKKLLLLTLIPFLFFPIHFLFNMNLDHSALWIEDNVPYRFTQRIADDSKLSNQTLSVGGYRMRTLTVAYQNLRLGGVFNQIQGSHYPEYLSDFQIVRVKDDEDWLDYYSIEDYEATSGLSLLKRKEAIKTIELIKSYPENSSKTANEYYSLHKGGVDSLLGETLLIKASITINSPEKPLVAWLVAVTNDKNKKRVAYEFVSLDWKKKQWNGEKDNFDVRLFMHEVPKESEVLSIYFWNVEQKKIELSDIQINIDQIID